MYNAQRFNKFCKHFDETSKPEEIFEWLQDISKYSRTIIETKWGLKEGTTSCPNYKVLEMRLNLAEAEKAYVMAEQELEGRKYIDLLYDSKDFDFRIAQNIVMLCKKICKAEKIAQVEKLPELEKNILKLRFGLIDGIRLDATKVATMYELNLRLCKQFENKAIKRLKEMPKADCISIEGLKNLSKKYNLEFNEDTMNILAFSGYEKTEIQEKTGIKFEIIESTLKSIEEIDFREALEIEEKRKAEEQRKLENSLQKLGLSPRAQKALELHGIKTIDQFMELTMIELSKTSIGYFSKKEIIDIRIKLKKPL